MALYPTKPADGNVPMTSFTQMYMMTANQVNVLLYELNTSTFIDNIKLLFNAPIESIISLRCYPFRVSTIADTGDTMSIQISNVDMTSTGTPLLKTSPSMLSFGTITVPTYFNNFLDFAPYTKLELYLPYIGFVPLETNEVMGKDLLIQYAVDFLTGLCTAFVSVNDPARLLITADGQIGIDVPVGATNAAEIAKNNLITGISTGAGLISSAASAAVTGNAMGVVGTLASAGVNAINANQVHVSKGAIGNGTTGLYAPQQAFLTISRPVPRIPVSYEEHCGRPSGLTKHLQQLTGYTEVDRVHVEGLDIATEDEITEVERLLKSGVIL